MNSFLMRVFFVSLFSLSGFASETISSGQPGQSIGADILSKGYLQYQTNLDYSGLESLKSNASNTVLRFGLLESLEISADYSISELDVQGSKRSNSWAFGLRYQILNEVQVVPLVFQMRYGESNSFYRLNSILSSSGDLGHGYSWGVNLIYNLIEESGNRTAYTLNLMYALNKKVGLFVENYGYNQEGQNLTFFDAGFSYLINKDLQFDASAGYGNSRSLESFFINIGLSGRFKIF